MIVAQPLKFDTSDKVAFGYKIKIKSNFFIGMTFNFGHKCTTNESNANHLKSIFNKVI